MKGKKGSKSPRKAKATAKAPRTDVVVPFPKDAVRRPPAKKVDASWVRVRLQNGYGAALAVVNSDWNRMWSMAQGLGARKTFAVFTTTTRHVAVNLRYASAMQFDGVPGEGLIAEGLPLEGSKTGIGKSYAIYSSGNLGNPWVTLCAGCGRTPPDSGGRRTQ
jgi:hypothetical protein